MTLNFIKLIINKQVDDICHKKFIRYSLGKFEKEPFEVKIMKKNFSIKAGPEYYDVLQRFFLENIQEPMSVNGKIIAQRNISNDLTSLGIEPVKITGNGKKAQISCSLINQEELTNIFEKLNDTFLLLDLISDKNTLKMKKTFPRGKLVPGFCKAKFDISLFDKFKDEFLWDVSDFTNASITHTYIVEDIQVSDELLKEDPARARKEAKRKGKLIRQLEIDGEVSKKEFELLV